MLVLLVASEPTDSVFLSLAQEVTNKAATPLPQPGKTITHPLSKESPHQFETYLEANQYLAVVLRKSDLWVAARLFGPKDEPLGEFISTRYEPLYVFLVSEKAGKHRLEIRSLEKNDSSGAYDLKVEAQQSPTGDDLKIIEARRLVMEAGRLRAEWKEPAIREAIVKYSEALKLWQAIGRHEDAANTLDDLGDTHFSLSEYRQAQENYFQAARMVGTSDHDPRIRALNRAGYVDIYLGRSPNALAQATRALSYYARKHSPTAMDQRNEAEAENTAGEASYSLGRLRQSIEFFKRALRLWKLAGDRRGQALGNLNLGFTYSDLGDLAKARECFEFALRMWREIDDRRGEALTLTARGTIHSFLGEKQSALDNHVQAMNILQVIGDRAGEAATLNSIGTAYEELNEPQTAIDNYRRALDIYQQLGIQDFEAVTKFYLGGVYKTLGDRQKALEYFQESLAQSRLVGQQRVTAYALSAISALRSSEGHHQEALLRLNQVLRIYRGIGDRRGQATALYEIGRIHQALGATKKALGYYRQALLFSRAAGDRNSESATLYQMALAARDSGALEVAVQYIEDSTKAIESSRAQIISPELRASYFASMHKHSVLYIDLLMRLDKLQPEKRFAELAFEASESARARALLEIISEAAANIRQGANPDLLAREQLLQQQLSAKAAYQMRVLSADKNEIEIAEREIRELTTAYHDLQTQIKQQSPRYASLVQPQPLKLAEIQSELHDSDTLLLEYALGEKTSYLWAATSDFFAAFELPERERIESTAGQILKLLIARQALIEDGSADYEKHVAAADEEYWRQAAALSDMVLKPVAHLVGRKRLLVVADGALQYVPFEALPFPSGALNQNSEMIAEPAPLVLSHEIVSLPSASTLAVIRRGEQSNREAKLVAVLADPVFEREDPRVRYSGKTVAVAPSPTPTHLHPKVVRDIVAPEKIGIPRLLATRQEAEAIMEVIPAGEGITAMDFDAAKAITTSGELGRYRIVHFATHGVINTEHPELSGIMLSLFNRQGESEDGFLQLHDIYNLDLAQTQLVVLSACRTGLGKEVKGEGVMGLTRGFMYAGSNSVIASLWKVDDRATAELMKHFYRAMFEAGLTPAAALRKAKESMWRQPRWRAPYFWAAFILQGEYRDAIAVPHTNRFRNYSLIGIVVVLFVIAGSIYGWKWRRLRKG